MDFGSAELFDSFDKDGCDILAVVQPSNSISPTDQPAPLEIDESGEEKSPDPSAESNDLVMLESEATTSLEEQLPAASNGHLYIEKIPDFIKLLDAFCPDASLSLEDRLDALMRKVWELKKLEEDKIKSPKMIANGTTECEISSPSGKLKMLSDRQLSSAQSTRVKLMMHDFEDEWKAEALAKLCAGPSTSKLHTAALNVSNNVTDALFEISTKPMAQPSSSGKENEVMEIPQSSSTGYECLFRSSTLGVDSGDSTDAETNSAAPKRPPMVCFNCGGEHSVRQCPEPVDQKRVQQNRRNMPKKEQERRYIPLDTKFSKYKPGIISDDLRACLSLRSDQVAPWIYQMRMLGYPPGYLKQAEIAESGLVVYGDDGQAVENGVESSDDLKQIKYSVDMIVEYPGFNVPVPEGFVDESDRLRMPPMQAQHAKDIFISYINGESISKPNESSESQSGTKNHQFGALPPPPALPTLGDLDPDRSRSKRSRSRTGDRDRGNVDHRRSSRHRSRSRSRERRRRRSRSSRSRDSPPPSPVDEPRDFVHRELRRQPTAAVLEEGELSGDDDVVEIRPDEASCIVVDDAECSGNEDDPADPEILSVESIVVGDSPVSASGDSDCLVVSVIPLEAEAEVPQEPQAAAETVELNICSPKSIGGVSPIVAAPAKSAACTLANGEPQASAISSTPRREQSPMLNTSSRSLAVNEGTPIVATDSSSAETPGSGSESSGIARVPNLHSFAVGIQPFVPFEERPSPAGMGYQSLRQLLRRRL